MPSPHRQGRRALAGTIIIVVLTVLALATFFLDRVLPLFRRTYTVVAVFPTAPGVRSGTPVWVAGVPVGTIREIALLPPHDTLERIALDMELSRSVAEQLRRDSQVRFASLQMIGEKVVEVLPGSAASPQLVDGDTLRVRTSGVDAAQLTASAAQARLALDSLMTDAGALRKQFARRQRDLAGAMRQAHLARRELAALQAGMKGAGSLKRLMTLQQPGGPIDRAQKRLAEVQRLFGQAQQRLGGARREIAPAQQRLTAHIHELQGDIAALRAQMNGPGTLPRMQQDSALQRAIAGARADLDSLITEAKKHPTRFVF